MTPPFSGRFSAPKSASGRSSKGLHEVLLWPQHQGMVVVVRHVQRCRPFLTWERLFGSEDFRGLSHQLMAVVRHCWTMKEKLLVASSYTLKLQLSFFLSQKHVHQKLEDTPVIDAVKDTVLFNPRPSRHPSGQSCCRPAQYPAEQSSCAWSCWQISA